MSKVMYVVRLKGHNPQDHAQVIDEVFFDCPECGKLFYDESLPTKEFRKYMEHPRNPISCDDCMEVGRSVYVYDVFQVTVLVGYISEEARLEVVTSLLEQLRKGVKVYDLVLTPKQNKEE